MLMGSRLIFLLTLYGIKFIQYLLLLLGHAGEWIGGGWEKDFGNN